MGYALGIDLGTTFTAAAVESDGCLSMAELGSDGVVVPSAALLGVDGVVVVGEGAVRRSAAEPSRFARAFKRRIGDPDPILLGGSPFSSEALTACLLRWTVDHVIEVVGLPPTRVAVTHPAHWGPYKLDLLIQAVRLADVKVDNYLTESEAAAVWFARKGDVAAGTVVAVYDLGGGTFDACVLRKAAVGFDVLGSPEGIERLGGLDFDRAVLAHIARGLGGAVEALDHTDPAALAALERLQQACVRGKEALSVDDQTSVEVILPNLHTERHITRHELEHLLRPPVAESIVAFRRAVRSAGLVGADVDVVLLVGGSSRIPLVAQLVGDELGRPVAVSNRPDEAVALGAALVAGGGR